MAADLNPDWISCLPSSWSYGVTQDGRIFFLNEEAKSTTWLHPVTRDAVITGHRNTPDLPTGWEEGYTFEGARCFINHNERKVTCKHPVSGIPSQDNCIFVINDQVNCAHTGTASKPETASKPGTDRPAPRSEQGDKAERPLSTMSEASNYTDYSTHPSSPSHTTTRLSRSSRKVHNFGKRSNSIKRNPNAPAMRSSWLYKQDSTGMKLWKKRWFVLSDMCLFYYRDEKEEVVLGSILLPSFHISMLSVDDHISRKYAFKATHPNMRTYYFCTDTVKDMEAWMKVMTDAALVHTEPIRRQDKLKLDQENHHVLTRPEIQNNERNRQAAPPSARSSSQETRREEKSSGQRDKQRFTLQSQGDTLCLQKDGVSYTLQRDGERLLLHREEERKTAGQEAGEDRAAQMEEKYAPSKDGEKYLLTRDGEKYALERVGDHHTLQRNQQGDQQRDCHTLQRDQQRDQQGDCHTLQRNQQGDQQRDQQKDCYALQRDQKGDQQRDQQRDCHALQRDQKGDQQRDCHTLQRNQQRDQQRDCHTLQRDQQRDQQKHALQKELRRQLSLREGEDKYRTYRGDKYATVKEVDYSSHKYATVKEGDYSSHRVVDKYGTLRVQGDKYGFQRDGFQRDGSCERPLTNISSIKLLPAQAAAIAASVSACRQAQLNGPGERPGDCIPGEVGGTLGRGPGKAQAPEPETGLSRTSSMQQLEHWVRTQKTRGPDEDVRSMVSYQTLPRNMPSHRAPPPHYPEGYRTLPRKVLPRPDSVCSVAGSLYDHALRPAPQATPLTAAEKRRSMRDDTMWQLYEWQQRQACSRNSLALTPAPPTRCSTLPSPRTRAHPAPPRPHAVPPSPSHGSLYSSFSPPRQALPPAPRCEITSPDYRGDLSIDRRHRPHHAKHPAERRSLPPALPAPPISAQSLQGKTSEELTLLLIQLRRQQSELSSARQLSLTQLLCLSRDTPNAKSDVLSHHIQRNLMYLDSQMKENEPLIFMIHTMIENSAPRPQLYQQTPQDQRDNTGQARPEELDIQARPEELDIQARPEELDIDTKLSRLCEQDKAVRTQEDKLQQLHREKHTLETALLSASLELEQHSPGQSGPGQSGPGQSDPGQRALVQQRDVLQSGLLGTCRELSRVTAELERSRREHDRLQAAVCLAKTSLLSQLETLGSPQTEPPSQQHVQIQRELWRIQDVMEALAKNKKSSDTGVLVSSLNNNKGTDYRLCKSEPELTTVKEEAGENTGEDRRNSNPPTERQAPASNDLSLTASKAGPPLHPVGVVPPRTRSPPSPPQDLVSSYVTLRKKPETHHANGHPNPRSVVEQASAGERERESGRARMSVEEQLERIRRHQQATMRDKRRDPSPPPPSTSTQDLDAALRELEKIRDQTSLDLSTLDQGPGAGAGEMKVEEEEQTEEGKLPCGEEVQSEATESFMSHSEQTAPPQDVEILRPQTDLQNSAHTSTRQPSANEVLEEKQEEVEEEEEEKQEEVEEEEEEKQEEVEEEEEEKQEEVEEENITVSYDDSKHNNNILVSVKGQPPSSSPTQLPDGSHFMCV
ncbi:pleckstrin homology domain-containing family A member 5-like isoform X2 [Osmerus eperlanus]|uniref:pleckstrin homology domain-containing family A member 5-like isoform X2 n=1 Tax=Osmerus eperlanus TaxID=29151 RepID=UPI002E0D9F01